MVYCVPIINFNKKKIDLQNGIFYPASTSNWIYLKFVTMEILTQYFVVLFR